MARRKSTTTDTTDTTPQEESMTATDTVIEEVEPKAPKAKDEAPKVDHEANLFTALMAFGKDSDIAALQEAYRAVPPAARGRVQGIALKNAMSEGLDVDSLSAALEAFNSLPAATKSTRTKVELDPTIAGAIRLFGLMRAYDSLREELGDDAHNQADQWLQAGSAGDHDAAVARVSDKVVKAALSGSGSGGPRHTFSEKLGDLIADGRLPVGATVSGANDAEAVVVTDGLEINGEVFENPTPAAKLFRVNKEGKQTSTNGWDFWTYEGKPIGSLREK